VTSSDNADATTLTATRALQNQIQSLLPTLPSSDGIYRPATTLFTGFDTESDMVNYIAKNGYSRDPTLITIGVYVIGDLMYATTTTTLLYGNQPLLLERQIDGRGYVRIINFIITFHDDRY